MEEKSLILCHKGLTGMDDQQENEELKQLAQCLKDFLGLDRYYTNPYSILYFLANQTLAHIVENKHIHFSSAEIAKSVAKVNSEPSAWISQNWKKINSDLKQKYEKSLSEFALSRGLNKYPWVAKIDSTGGAGIQAQYHIVGFEIDSSILVKSDSIFADEPYDIEYVAVQSLKPSYLARFIFNNNYTAIGWRKWLLVFYPLAQMILCVLLVLVFILVFYKSSHPINTQDLVYLIFVYLAYLGCKYIYQDLNIFIDDRLIMASDHLLGFKEANVVQEIVTVNDAEGNFLHKKVQLVKYVAVCKVCGTQVVLEKGEPNFRRRIVGRCKESPREHVYSFDRVTKKGSRLL